MTDTKTADERTMHSQISGSIGTLWNNYSGSRPAEITTTIRDSKVKCVLTDAVANFDSAIDTASKQDIGDGERRLTMYTFRREAMEIISRITHRQVLAFVSDHDQKTDVATEVFIVDSPPALKRSIFVARQNLDD